MPYERRSGPDRRVSVTVVLVDDEALIRAALAHSLSAGGVDVVGEAASGEEAIELVLDLRPDVVLIDVKLPGISGVETIERLGLLAPASRTLVLARAERNRVVDAIIAGASGYILKSAPPEQILNAVLATALGESVLSPQVAGRLLERIRELDIPVVPASEIDANAIRAVLTERELEIFGLLASGDSNQRIGQRLSLSANTIANHITSILDKLHLENRIQAAAQAIRAGLS